MSMLGDVGQIYWRGWTTCPCWLMLDLLEIVDQVSMLVDVSQFHWRGWTRCPCWLVLDLLKMVGHVPMLVDVRLTGDSRPGLHVG